MSFTDEPWSYPRGKKQYYVIQYSLHNIAHQHGKIIPNHLHLPPGNPSKKGTFRLRKSYPTYCFSPSTKLNASSLLTTTTLLLLFR